MVLPARERRLRLRFQETGARACAWWKVLLTGRQSERPNPGKGLLAASRASTVIGVTSKPALETPVVACVVGVVV